jgi:hypothetical protein
VKRGWLLIVPAIGVALTICLSNAFGPFWVGPNYDPEYVYLVNSLGILEGHAPVHTDHPGTPLQLLGAGVIATVHSLTDAKSDLARSVLSKPEKYLGCIRAVLVALWVVATIMIGLAAAGLTGSALCAMLVQAAPLMSLQGALSLTRASPEPLLLIISILIGTLALNRSGPVFSPNQSRRDSIRVGGLLGIGVATKVTFFPVGAFCLLCVRNTRARVVVTIAAITAFVVAVSPIFTRWSSVFRWFGKLVLGTETYGEGPRTVINPTSYSRGLVTLLAAEPLLFVLAALSFATWIGLRRARDLRPENHARLSVALLGVALAELLQIAITAKYPVPRYMVPAIGLAGLNVGLLWQALHEAMPTSRRRAAKVAFTVAALAAGVFQAYRVSTTAQMLSRRRDEAIRLTDMADRIPNRVLAFGYGSSGEGPALWFANTWARNRYSPLLEELHPRTVEFHLGWKVFLRHGVVVPQSQIDEWTRRGQLVVQMNESNLPSAMRLEPIARTGFETLGRVVR